MTPSTSPPGTPRSNESDDEAPEDPENKWTVIPCDSFWKCTECTFEENSEEDEVCQYC